MYVRQYSFVQSVDKVHPPVSAVFFYKLQAAQTVSVTTLLVLGTIKSLINYPVSNCVSKAKIRVIVDVVAQCG